MKFNKYNVLHLAKHSPGMQQGWDIYLAGEKLCGKGPRVSGEHKLHMSERVVLQQRKTTGSWVASKSASAAEIKKWLHHSAQCFPVHTWKLIFVPSIQQQKKCEQAGKGPEKSQNDYPRTEMSAMWGKAERTALFSLEETRLRGDFFIMIQYLKAGYKDFLLWVPWKKWVVQVTSGDILVYTRGAFFIEWKISHWNILPR